MKNAFEITEDTKIDLYNHFNQFRKVKFTDEQYAMVESRFYTYSVKKGDHLFLEGTVPQFGGYIHKGCVRYYRTDDEGNDHTFSFFTEGDCVSDCNASMNNLPVSYNAQALEDCELVCLNHTHYDFLSENCYPFLQFYVAKKELQAREQMEHLCSIQTRSAQDRYLDLLKTNPGLLLRVPQHYIASYIGVHSRSFSRLKRGVCELESCAQTQSALVNIMRPLS